MLPTATLRTTLSHKHYDTAVWGTGGVAYISKQVGGGTQNKILEFQAPHAHRCSLGM